MKQKNMPTSSRLLSCAGLHESYHEYMSKIGGYNLYDAIEFKKFKRFDLYADNILSVIHDLSFEERNYYCA